jgi:S1-C subfamily serine protease
VRAGAELSLEEIAAYAQRWTAAVRADRNYGAAVILDRAGLLLTNQHVIDSARSILVTPFGGEAHGATVLDKDAQLDLA